MTHLGIGKKNRVVAMIEVVGVSRGELIFGLGELIGHGRLNVSFG